MKYYWANDGEMLISEEDLRKGYEDLKAEGNIEEETFEDYLIDCTTGNGDLTPLRQDELFLTPDGELTCYYALKWAYEDDRSDWEWDAANKGDYLTFKEWAETKDLVQANWE